MLGGCVAAGAFVGWFVTYLIVRRSRQRVEDNWATLCQVKYDEGYSAHRTKLLRQMHDGRRTHVPHDEAEPRPIVVHKRRLRVTALPKLPGRN